MVAGVCPITFNTSRRAVESTIMAPIKQLIKRLLVSLGIDFYLKTPDRLVLEGQIIPWLSALPQTQRVLFVGCDWYTHGYRKWFKPATYWTLDYDPAKRLYGSPKHITDSMANLASHFAPGSLDLIICNGVYGWGLDARTDVEAAFSAVGSALRPGGLFLLGWNDVPEHRPMPLSSIAALASLRAAVIEPLGVSQMLTNSPNRHTFNLYIKP
jgi:SAM-dependent methyltransferase